MVVRLEFLFAFGPPKAPWRVVWGLVDLGGLLGAKITPRTCYVCKDVYECSLFFTECRMIIDMGMPHLNALERERLACLLARSRFVRDMPQRADLTA